jgi:phytoene dehydrogenase-like protein
MAQTYDAVVIGAGHNGLTCACYLAKAGLKVLVLDQYGIVGGMSTTEELTLPGFKSDVHAIGYQFANLSPAPQELRLAERGFTLIRSDPDFAHVFPDGSSVSICRDIETNCDSIARYSRKDAATWRRLSEQFSAQKQMIAESINNPPLSFADQAAMLESIPGGLDQYRFQMQTFRSWADETFEAEQTKLLIGTWAAHTSTAPDDAGGASLAWLFAHVIQDGGNNLVQGGMQNLSLGLAAVLHSHNGEIRTSTPVSKILIDNGKAVAVRLGDGAEIEVGTLVASSVDPRHLVFDLIGEDHVGKVIAEKIRRYEWGVAAMSLFLALDGPVHYKAGAVAQSAACVHGTPASLDYFGRLFLQVRSGLLPAEPFAVAWNEATIDPSRAPAGKSLMKFFVSPVPYVIRGDAARSITGTIWSDVQEAFADRVIDRLSHDYIPDLRERIIERAVQTPVDFERLIPSAYRGTVMHGAPLSYQMGALRPIPELGGYKTPVPNVYLCGAGSHPGPGISMGPGRNAAQVIYKELGLDFAKTAARA